MPTTPHSTPRSRRSRAGSATGGCDAEGKVPTTETETPKPRAVANIRESTEEQGQGFSPDAQREQIRKFAAETGSTSARNTRTSTPAGARPTPVPSSSG